MNVTITGATGFIGRRLVDRLKLDAHQVTALSRKVRNLGDAVWSATWDPMMGPPPAENLNSRDAIVHLAGEPVAQRWTPAAKRAIRDSRVTGTRHLIEGLGAVQHRPQTLICASAIGIYGDRGDEMLTESSRPATGFLAETCKAWEKEAEGAAALGMRVVKLRIGVVLGRGGALEKMLPPFKMGVGGRLASGRQWMSWIHLDDLIGLVLHALQNPAVQGVVNATAPNPVTNSDFTRALASAVHRPAIFPVPGFVIKTLFGEMATILLDSQRVLPKAAETSGYRFQQAELGAALSDVLRS